MTLAPDSLAPFIREVAREVARETIQEVRRQSLTDAEQLRSVTDLAASLPFSRSKVYKWVQEAEMNGLARARAVVKIDGRWYVHAGRFSRWLEGQER